MSRSTDTSHTGLALSIRQPWADQVLSGKKVRENRSQPVKIRGRIYIYASKSGAPRQDDGATRGMIVGEVTLYGCRRNGDGYAWLLKDPVRWRTPKPPERRANPVWFKPWDESNATAAPEPSSGRVRRK